MLGLWANGALNVLRSIPREVWLIAAAVLALWLWGNHREASGRAEERAEWIAKLEQAEAEAKARAERAARAADEQERERAAEFEAEQESLREIIDEAESTGANPLDSLVRLW